MKAALALCLLSAGCLAQQNSNPADSAAMPIDPAFAADIKRLMEDAGVNSMMSQMLDQSLAAASKNIKANPALKPEFVDEFVRRYKARMLDGHAEEILLHEFAKLFTPDDVKQMITYQESPVGRKAVRLMPQLMSDLFQQSSTDGRKVVAEVAQEIAKEHPEYLKKPQSETSSANSSGGVIGGVLGGAALAPQPKEVKTVEPITKVNPDYPPLAKAARIQGTVVFKAVIGTDGKIDDLQLVSGHPLLVNAAREAVLQWTYEPVTLDGRATKVATEVRVNFNLGSATDSEQHD